MALNLSDFKESAIALSDFEGQLPLGKTVNKKTARVLAAQQAAVTGASPADYDRIKTNLLDPETQQRFILNQQHIRDQVWEGASQKLVPEVMADPNLDFETKDTLINQALIPQGARPPLSTMSALAYTAASADIKDNPTEAGEEARSLLVGMVERTNQRKRDRQAAINAIELSRDDTTANMIVDMAEVMAPFAEWIHIDQLTKDVTGEGLERSQLLGQQKANLFKQIKQIPLDKRAEFTERVLDLVQNNAQIVLPDGNNMMAHEVLNQMLVNNDYSDFDRWFDNVTSVLDVVGIGALARGAKAKGAARAAKGATQRARGIDGEIIPPSTDDAVRASEDLLEGPVIDGTAVDITKEGLPTPGRPELLESPEAVARREEALSYKSRTEVSPAAPSQVVKDVNPHTAREMHKAAMSDESGETAEALYGTNRREAAAKDLLPEPEIRAGRMENKASMGPSMAEPAELYRIRKRSGRTWATEAELQKFETNTLTPKLKNIEGMHLHEESLVIRDTELGFGITARYSPPDSGFRTWDEAVAKASFSFRKLGLTEEHFTPLVRRGDEWVETTPEEIFARKSLSEGGVEFDDVDFAIGIKYNYGVTPGEMELDQILSSNTGLGGVITQMDRIPGQFLARTGQGSLVQNILSPESYIDPMLMNPGHVGMFKSAHVEKMYRDMYQDFVKPLKKLPKERRRAVEDYLHQANLEGIDYNVEDLINRGFNEAERETLRKFREASDALWYAANDDMRSSLIARGFKVFSHEASGTKMVGVPISRTAANSAEEIFDAVGDTVTTFDKAQLDELYESGGELLRLSEPTQIDGKWVDLIVSRNTPEQGFTRAIYDGERVMAYRPGWYFVEYDANRFIEMEVPMAGGQWSKAKVVATSKTTSEAKEAIKALQAEYPDARFRHRGDRKKGTKGDRLLDEGSWSHVTNSNLSVQRVRGQRLADAGNDLYKMGNAHLKDPLESISGQIRQLSQRVSTRDWLEASRKRWINSFKDDVDLPIDPKTGQVKFPESVADIKPKEGASKYSKAMAHARTNFNYIHAMENGFINQIDEGLKAVTNMAAEMLGEAGLSKAETALYNLAEINPNRAAKQVAFKMLLSAAPLRQRIIQSGQILQLAAIEPTYTATRLLQDLVLTRNARMGLPSTQFYKDLAREADNLGIYEAMDVHTLVRGEALSLAERSWKQVDWAEKSAVGQVGRKVWQTAKAPLDLAQKHGFDAAERDVVLTAYMAFREKAIRAGKDIKSIRVKEEILAEARMFTGAMDRAGDMAYTHNTISLVAQFLSFQHKMMIQPFLSKSLTKRQRAQILAYNTAMFGIMYHPITAMMDSLFGDAPSETKDMVHDGLVDVALNRAISLAAGENTAIDFGDLAPLEAYGISDLIVSSAGGSLPEIVANTPAGSMLFGGNPRITEAFKTAFGYFVPGQDWDNPELQYKFSDVAVAAANMFSGASAFFKADYAWETGKKMSSYGSITDDDVNKWEAAAALFGFQTKTEDGYRQAKAEMYGTDYAGSRAHEQDFDIWYGNLKRHLARRGSSPAEDKYMQAVLSEGWAVFGKYRPATSELLIKKLNAEARDGDFSVLKGITDKMGMATEDEMWKIINKLPAGNVRDVLTETMNMRYGEE